VITPDFSRILWIILSLLSFIILSSYLRSFFAFLEVFLL